MMNKTTAFVFFSFYTWSCLSKSLAWILPLSCTRHCSSRSTILWLAKTGNHNDDDDDEEFYETKFDERKDRSERDWQQIPFASNNPYPMEYRSDYDQASYEEEEEEMKLDETRSMVYNGEEDVVDNELKVDDDNDDSLHTSIGNFWVNPRRGLDPYPPVASSAANSQQRRRSRPSGDIPPSTSAPHERRPPSRSRNPYDDPRSARRKTTFRSGTPPPPPVLKDFYSRLFWYGFDSDEFESAGGDSKTMFGGTKGKFNGLALVNEEQRPANLLPPRRANPPLEGRKRRPWSENERQPRKDDYWMDENDDEFDDTTDDYETEEASLRERPDDDAFIQPPGNSPLYERRPISKPMQGIEDESTRRTRRPRPRGRDSEPNFIERSSDEDDWVSNEVSSWFTKDDSNEQDRGDRRKSSRKRQQGSQPWDIFKSLGNVFGLNDREREYQAEAYNRRMGLEPKDSARRRKRTRENQRSGYAYRYIDDDKEPPIADLDVANDSEEIDDDRPPLDKENNEDYFGDDAAPRKQRTWKERAIAVERVPPANIDAWGPTGDLGMDARTKSWMDAQEDIRNAKFKLEERERRASQAREDVIVLKADAELQRKRLSQGRQDPRSLQVRLRQIELEIDDAARALRRALALVQAARDEMNELEDRHWAVLSLFDADRAQEEIVDAFRELEEQEPALRYARSRDEKQADQTNTQT